MTTPTSPGILAARQLGRLYQATARVVDAATAADPDKCGLLLCRLTLAADRAARDIEDLRCLLEYAGTREGDTDGR